jgi:2,3-bisphosphoglycerate-dependent phosphoglycerate mutase
MKILPQYVSVIGMTINIQDLNEKYSKEKVDVALATLNYHNAPEMPKHEIEGRPTIYIFRHGQSQDNVEYLFSGWRDPELTEKGKAQALVLADKLKDKKIQMLISSTQKRAIETMKLAMSKNPGAQNLKINTDPRIRERSYGDLQGTSKLEMQLENPEQLKEYRRSYLKKANNGESLEDVIKRVKNFCDEIVPLIKTQRINVAISCHGNSIRGFRKYFEDLPVQELCELETPLAQDYLAYSLN